MEPEEVRKVLDDPVARELLSSPLLARLAYVGPDSFPRVVPIGYLWKEGRFVICTAPKAPKVAALQRDPKVALEVDAETQPPHILLVRGTATVEIVDGIPAEYLAASRKAIPDEQWDDFESQVRGLYPQMARIAVTPVWAKVIDFERTLPQAIEGLVAGR